MSTSSLFPLHRRLIWLTLLFLLVGQILLFSATGVLGLQRYGSEFYYVSRQALCACVGFLLMLAVSKMRYQVWSKLAFVLLLVQIGLIAATYFAGFGHYAQGATRWLRLGPFAFQPSEFSKVTAVVYVARILAQRQKMAFTLTRWIAYAIPFFFLLFLILKQPDMGTPFLLVSITLGLFFISGTRLLHLACFLGTGGIFFLFSMLNSEYRRRRLFAFLNPWADPQGNGFQVIQSFLSIHSGKLLGVGLGNGNSKLFYLPEVHTDFIFALVGEELGFVGAVLLLLLFTYFAYLLFKIAFRAKDPFGCYLAFGLSFSIVLQIGMNLGAVTGLLPVKGLALPFLSWGRSALVVHLFSMGILLNILKQSVLIPDPTQAGG